jgi:hypothetical protein
MSERDWSNDLMVSDDDAGCIHWRSSCCKNGCYQFFANHGVAELYPPWDKWYAESPSPTGSEP